MRGSDELAGKALKRQLVPRDASLQMARDIPCSAAGSKTRNMIVAGVMSGTSADGVDVAFCRIGAAPTVSRVSRGIRSAPRIKLLAHEGFAYPKKLRDAVLAAMDAPAISVAELARLSWRLGAFYAECVETAAMRAGLRNRLALVGCHGQTIYHQANAQRYLGEQVRCTWQIGEPSLIAERLRVPVVSDLRPADLAAGGQGAPLVPMLDYTLFQHRTRSRILLNLGGIANMTVLPAGGDAASLLAFDTGPANMVIDALMQRHFGKRFDRGGGVAARGRVIDGVVSRLMRMPFFAAAPPKSCGREEFGAGYANRLERMCSQAARNTMPEDFVATATALTVSSICEAVTRFALPHLAQHASADAKIELWAAGGGARNSFLMSELARGLDAEGVQVKPMEGLGVAAEAKEAMAFALLAWLRWHGLPGNLPAATGAARAVPLGKVTLA